jgi:hypothetical protein
VNSGVSSIPSSQWPHLVANNGEIEEGRFATSQLCARCHSNHDNATALRDAAGREVGPYDLWQASPMANAARDPLFRAEVSVEIAATPSLKAVIEAKCLGCHSPMAADTASAGQPLELAMLERQGPREQLALDGVSCTLCHQIEPTADVASTFDGNYELTAQRTIYGPYDDPDGSPMYIRTQYLPTGSDHITESALCASCHTLTTHAVTDAGVATGGSVLEQSPYLEWQNSVFNDEIATPGAEAASCQGCHVPTTDEDGNVIATKVARTLSGDFISPALTERQPYGRHLFLGGNTLLLQILRENRGDLQPTADDAAFLRLEALTRAQLRNDTAQVSVGTLTRTGDQLEFTVGVVNDTGHKFPTGHPTRRAWLRVLVRDAQGQVVFQSGQHDFAGRIVGSTGQVLPSESAGGPLMPHFDRVTSGDQVQVFESVMADGSGMPTYLLLRGEGYVKDNRLLPRGWVATHPTATSTAPQGVGTDGTFTGGADRVTYAVSAPAGGAPYTVEASLLFQSLSARFADELFQYETREVAAFRSYYQNTNRMPEAVASATASE